MAVTEVPGAVTALLPSPRAWKGTVHRGAVTDPETSGGLARQCSSEMQSADTGMQAAHVLQ